MKNLLSAILTMLMAFLLASCASGQEPAPAAQSSCGHEAYLDLIAMLEKQDYEGARDFIDKLEGKDNAVHIEPVPTQSARPAPALPPEVNPADYPGAEIIPLDRHNLLTYFDLRDDYIFEDQVTCYQNLRMKQEYTDRLLEVKNVTVEISYFHAAMYGEPDKKDQLFYSSRYDMTTGELEIRKIDVTANGEGYIMLGIYDDRKGCIPGYAMDIAIREATGALILEKE